MEFLTLLSEGFGEQLVNLEVLVLKNCHKLGSLPESISGLKALKVLDLSSDAMYNGLIIPMSLQSLPERFGDLPNLQSLNLNRCENLQTLPAGILAHILRILPPSAAPSRA